MVSFPENTNKHTTENAPPPKILIYHRKKKEARIIPRSGCKRNKHTTHRSALLASREGNTGTVIAPVRGGHRPGMSSMLGERERKRERERERETCVHD